MLIPDMNEPTRRQTGSPSIQGDVSSQELEKGAMLSPFLVWANKSEIEVRQMRTGIWQAKNIQSDNWQRGHTRELAAERAAAVAGVEGYESWRMRLAMAKASWHFPLWRIVSSLPGGKKFLGLAVGISKNEVRHLLKGDGYEHGADLQIIEVEPGAIRDETLRNGLRITENSVVSALRRGDCGMLCMAAA